MKNLVLCHEHVRAALADREQFGIAPTALSLAIFNR
jgi:hypothetical protein